jgi:hypothetical protein
MVSSNLTALLFLATSICSGRKTKLAKRHLKEIGELLGKIDPNLSELAKEPLSEMTESNTSSPKKRKTPVNDPQHLHIPKKKNVQSHDRSDTLTLSQREDKAMKNLLNHILDAGGKLLQ